jgi:molybdate transport system substrate-binding protein
VLTRKTILAAFAATIAIAAAPHAADAQDKSITVFAAASMKNALDDVDAAFTKKGGVKVVASYDASSALMKQIEAGAPADVFVSADLKWMDYGSQKKLIKDDTRVNLLGNELVLIAPKDSKIDKVTIGPGFDLAKLAGDGRIATGDVKAVPVGIYAQAALEKLGVWSAVEPKMAMTANVRAALVLVARGEALLGIVYSTDAKVEPGVKVVGVFPESSHDPIIYPVAATVNAKPDATPYLALLRSQAAKTIFESYGFTVLAKPTS